MQDSEFGTCPLCCPPGGHGTTVTPYWLIDSGTMPAFWRFIYHVVHDIQGEGLSRRERIDACRLFATIYGDRTLANAINKAKECGVPVDPVFDRVVGMLHKAARS